MKLETRIGLCGWNADEITLELLVELRGIGIDVAFLIANPENRNRLGEIKKLTRVIDQGEVIDVIVGKSPNAEWRVLGDKLKAYSTQLPLLLRAQERWLQGHWNVDDRLFMTHRAINYFHCLVEDEGVSSVVHCTGSPHHFFNLVLTVVGEREGISNFFLYYSFVTNRFFIVRGYEKIFYPLPASLQQIQQSSLKSYSELIEHVTTQRDTRHSSQLAFYKLSAKFAVLYLLLVLPRQLLRSFSREFIRDSAGIFLQKGGGKFGRFVNSVIELFWDFWGIAYFKYYYKKYCTAKIGRESYVIYASYQPEASSHPDGGEFPDARYVAADLMKSGIDVYYKEHPGTFLYHCVLYPNQFSKHRSLKYYEDLRSMGVKFLDLNMPNRDIFQANPVVVSNAGTVLLEAALNGVQARAIGHPWYGVFEGIDQYHFGGCGKAENEKHLAVGERRDAVLKRFMAIDASSFFNMFGVGAQVVDSCPHGEIARLSAAIKNVIEAGMLRKT